jgi:hypothetical protein
METNQETNHDITAPTLTAGARKAEALNDGTITAKFTLQTYENPGTKNVTCNTMDGAIKAFIDTPDSKIPRLLADGKTVIDRDPEAGMAPMFWGENKAALEAAYNRIAWNDREANFRVRENDDVKEATEPNSSKKRMAESFVKDTPEEATRKYPELAGAAAAVASIEKKAEADGLNPQQRAIVMARVRQNMVNSIERGQIPEVKVKEKIEVKREIATEKEHAR